jgi:hypothetical protein
MKQLLLLPLIICLHIVSDAEVPALVSARVLSSFSNESVEALHTDAAGNLYIAGGYHDEMDFDPGADVIAADGKTISEDITKSGNFRVDVAGYEQGIYILRYVAEGRSLYTSFVK